MTIYIIDMPYITSQFTFLLVKKIKGPTLYKLNDLDLSPHVGLLIFVPQPLTSGHSSSTANRPLKKG